MKKESYLAVEVIEMDDQCNNSLDWLTYKEVKTRKEAKEAIKQAIADVKSGKFKISSTWFYVEADFYEWDDLVQDYD